MRKTYPIVWRGNQTEVVDKDNTEVEQPHRGGRKDHTGMVESTTPGWRGNPHGGGEKYHYGGGENLDIILHRQKLYPLSMFTEMRLNCYVLYGS